MSDNDIRIGHSGDAINLINELIERLETGEITLEEIRAGIEALKDSIERGIV